MTSGSFYHETVLGSLAWLSLRPWSSDQGRQHFTNSGNLASPTQRVQEPLCHIHRPQSHDMVSSLRPRYTMYLHGPFGSAPSQPMNVSPATSSVSRHCDGGSRPQAWAPRPAFVGLLLCSRVVAKTLPCKQNHSLAGLLPHYTVNGIKISNRYQVCFQIKTYWALWVCGGDSVGIDLSWEKTEPLAA